MAKSLPVPMPYPELLFPQLQDQASDFINSHEDISSDSSRCRSNRGQWPSH